MRAALVLLAGCNVAFGISHVDPDAASEGDAPAVLSIAGRISENFVLNAANGLPAIQAASPEQNGVTIFVADRTTGLRSQVPYDFTDGAFAITAPGDAPARIQLAFGAQIYEWQWDQPALDIEIPQFSRAGQIAAPAGTTATGVVPAAATSIGVYASGVWQQLVATIGGSTWKVATWTGGLASGAKGDRVYVTSYETQPTNDTVLAKTTGPLSVEVAGGTNTVITGPFSAVMRDHCLSATHHLAEDDARMTARYPELTGGGGGSELLVYAMPFPQLGPGVAWLLMHTPFSPPATVTETYGLPFAGFQAVVTTYTVRPFTVEGVSLAAAVQRFELEQPCGSPPRDLAANSIALPAHGVLGGVPIATDNSTHVKLTDATTTFAWDADGPADLYVVQWFDLALKQYTPRQIQTRGTSIVVDTTDLLSGHKYAFLVIALKGLAGIGGGAVSRFGYPYERAVVFFPEVAID